MVEIKVKEKVVLMCLVKNVLEIEVIK